jgi:hypothetical protein
MTPPHPRLLGFRPNPDRPRRVDHSNNIFRRFTSRNRTSSSSSSFSLSSATESIPQGSNLSSLSTLVSPSTDGFPGDIRGPPRKSSCPDPGLGSNLGLGSGRGLPPGQNQSNPGVSDRRDHPHKFKSTSKSKPTPHTGPGGRASTSESTSTLTSNREWSKIKIVLRGNMGVGPNSGLAGAQRRSSATASAAGGGVSQGVAFGSRSGSEVKVEVFDVSRFGEEHESLRPGTNA